MSNITQRFELSEGILNSPWNKETSEYVNNCGFINTLFYLRHCIQQNSRTGRHTEHKDIQVIQGTQTIKNIFELRWVKSCFENLPFKFYFCVCTTAHEYTLEFP